MMKSLLTKRGLLSSLGEIVISLLRVLVRFCVSAFDFFKAIFVRFKVR